MLDSGASDHIFNDITRFVSLRMDQEGLPIQLASGYAQTKGVGTAVVEIRRNNGKLTLLTLNDVIYCPEFVCNLVSASKLFQQGIYWETRSPYCRLRHAGDTVLGEVDPMGGVFWLDRSHLTPTLRATVSFRRSVYKTSSTATAERWHLRLGHANDEATRRLAQHVGGVDLKNCHDRLQCRRPGWRRSTSVVQIRR